MHMLIELTRGNTEREECEKSYMTATITTPEQRHVERQWLQHMHLRPLALLFEGVGTARNGLVGRLNGFHLQGGGFLVQLLRGGRR